jgi:hypothetical protein
MYIAVSHAKQRLAGLMRRTQRGEEGLGLVLMALYQFLHFPTRMGGRGRPGRRIGRLLLGEYCGSRVGSERWWNTRCMAIGGR